MWARLQDKYQMPDSPGQPRSGSAEPSSHAPDGGIARDSTEAPPPGPGVGNSPAPGSLSTAGGGSGEAAPAAPAPSGLLRRLLNTMKAAKKGEQR